MNETSSRQRILIVDDSPPNIRVLVQALSQDYAIQVATNGAKALQLVASESPDLILLDVVMPGMSGHEVCQKLKADPATRGIPVIFISGQDEEADEILGLELGAVDYIVKPFRLPIVRARVRTHLELKRSTEALLKAQQKITQLLESNPGASGSIPVWSRAVCHEIARALGGVEIAVWELEKEAIVPLWETSCEAPALDWVRENLSTEARGFAETASGLVFPILGSSGEPCGVLCLNGKPTRWDHLERQFVVSFVNQLGSALEMARMRRRLAMAEEKREANRLELQARGIATLQICPRCSLCYDHNTPACPADGSPLDSPRVLPLLLLDRYRFKKVMGQGGMGIVFSADDEKLQREVAIKLIKPEHFGNSELRHRFDREARMIARIRHPGVIALFDSGELEDGTAFIVMEHLSGQNIKTLLGAFGPGTPLEVGQLIRQGTAALGAAHRAGIVHRDVKPENIFLTGGAEGTQVKILDFGLAKPMTVEKGLTQTGMVVGTPQYMSPEQIRGEDVDARSDLYSFAAVCYEALTGYPVAREDRLADIFIQVLSLNPDPVSKFLQGVPPVVDRAFALAFSKDPASRPSSCEEWTLSFVEDLERMPAKPGRTWSLTDGLEKPGILESTVKIQSHELESRDARTSR